MGMAGLILEPHLSKFGKSFLFHSCTSDVIVISRNSQRVKSYKNTQKPSSPGIQRFLGYGTLVAKVCSVFMNMNHYLLHLGILSRVSKVIRSLVMQQRVLKVVAQQAGSRPQTANLC